ncbi:MAG TPA: rod shape-determining protein MreC [Candidatus Paceibacterota bacterium]
MNLYLQNKPGRRPRRTLFFVTLLVIALFAIDFFTGGMVRGPLRSAGAMLSRATDTVARGIIGSGLLSTRSMLARENANLKQTIVGLEERLALYRAAQVENEELRRMAHLASDMPGITAPVVSSFKASPYGTFLAGAGSTEGVREGNVVLSKEGFVVGRVLEVSAHQALVEEIFAARTTIEAIAGSLPLSLTGNGGGNATGEAPRGSLIATGTPVHALSLGGRLVGVVGQTEGDVAASSLKVYVRTPVNIEALRVVYIIAE